MITEQEYLESLTLDKIEAWVRKFYADGGSIEVVTSDIVCANCIVGLYLNSTFKDRLVGDEICVQGKWRGGVANRSTFATFDAAWKTPEEIIFLVNIYDNHPVKTSNRYTLNECLSMIHAARKQWQVRYDPSYMMK